MSEWIAMIWPFLIVLVVLFIVTRFWVALVDTVFGVLKRLLGIKPKEIAWHTLDEGSGEKEGEEEK